MGGADVVKQANFSSCVLTSANMCGANLERANLESAHLHDADLSGALLQDTNFASARMRVPGTKLANTRGLPVAAYATQALAVGARVLVLVRTVRAPELGRREYRTATIHELRVERVKRSDAYKTTHVEVVDGHWYHFCVITIMIRTLG